MECCLLALWFTACTEDGPSTPVVDKGKDNLVLSYSIGGSEVSTRATEPGWDGDWHENLITRLDLLIFREGRRIAYTNNGTMDTNALQTDTDADILSWNIPLSTLFSNGEKLLADDIVYLIANCPTTTDLSTVTTLSALQAVTASGLVCNQKQASFLMDGKITVSADMLTDENNITVGVIPLKRAAAKICIKFSSKTDWNEVSYRFYHYVTQTQLVEQSEENTAQWDAEDTYLTTLTQPLPVYPTESDEMEKVNTTTTDNYYTVDKQLVLYSYVNSWFKPYEEGDKDHENPLVDEKEPIDVNKQTYILLYAPYGEGTDKQWYYYKIPVNYRLPSNNDDIDIDPSDYRHLYRLQRNYIYDITVNIDRPGGTVTDPSELANLTYEVNPWEREDVTVNYEDNLSYRSDGWNEEDEDGNRILELMDEGRTVHFLDAEATATLTFVINSPKVATWRAQLTGTDVTYFEFVDADGNHLDHVSGTADFNGNTPIEQMIHIKCTQPDSEETRRVELHVYATIGGIDYEMDLTDTSGEDMRPGSDAINNFTILQGR